MTCIIKAFEMIRELLSILIANRPTLSLFLKLKFIILKVIHFLSVIYILKIEMVCFNFETQILKLDILE
jgi:hypothetical protein